LVQLFGPKHIEQKVNVSQWLFLRNCEKELMEISLVTFPANELARVSTVKSAGASLETPRDFERFPLSF